MVGFGLCQFGENVLEIKNINTLPTTMLNILTIIGARPQIIKAAALSRAIRDHFADSIKEFILHSGQHYDDNMSGQFFDELGIPKPDFNLGVGSGSHGRMTGQMIAGIESILTERHFDGVVVYGDTNSTLAGALAACKLGVPVFHVEAGLRSFNMGMPEEINRILCDRIASLLFAPTKNAVENLRKEGFDSGNPTFGEVVLSGDIMYDNTLHYSKIAEEKCNILERMDLNRKGYVLATVHRDFNTDNPNRLRHIFKALKEIADERPVVVPLHPRTAKCIEKEHIDIHNLKIIDPVGFMEMLTLERNAQAVVTDSGGVQKEAFFLQTPAIILRPETEWTEIIENHAGLIADDDPQRITDGVKRFCNKQTTFPNLFGNGKASETILYKICSFL